VIGRDVPTETVGTRKEEVKRMIKLICFGGLGMLAVVYAVWYLVTFVLGPRSKEIAYPEKNKVWEWKNFDGARSYKAWVGNDPNGGYTIGAQRPHIGDERDIR
jgi:hypothetical protein